MLTFPIMRESEKTPMRLMVDYVEKFTPVPLKSEDGEVIGEVHRVWIEGTAIFCEATEYAPQPSRLWRTVMALGKRKKGGNFLPIIKFDARVGTFYLQDRVNSDGKWQTEQRDVTENFQAAFDLENLQRGWLWFPKGAAPQVGHAT